MTSSYEVTELEQGQDYTSAFAMAQYNSEAVTYADDGFPIFGSDDWQGDKYGVSVVNDVHWIGKRSKYFSGVMIPRSRVGKLLRGGVQTGGRRSSSRWIHPEPLFPAGRSDSILAQIAAFPSAAIRHQSGFSQIGQR